MAAKHCSERNRRLLLFVNFLQLMVNRFSFKENLTDCELFRSLPRGPLWVHGPALGNVCSARDALRETQVFPEQIQIHVAAEQTE